MWIEQKYSNDKIQELKHQWKHCFSAEKVGDLTDNLIAHYLLFSLGFLYIVSAHFDSWRQDGTCELHDIHAKQVAKLLSSWKTENTHLFTKWSSSASWPKMVTFFFDLKDFRSIPYALKRWWEKLLWDIFAHEYQRYFKQVRSLLQFTDF